MITRFGALVTNLNLAFEYRVGRSANSRAKTDARREYTIVKWNSKALLP